MKKTNVCKPPLVVIITFSIVLPNLCACGPVGTTLNTSQRNRGNEKENIESFDPTPSPISATQEHHVPKIEPAHPEAVAALESVGAVINMDPNGDVRVLNLTGTRVTDDDLKHLSVMTNLEMINLDGTQVTDVGLVHLANLKRLKFVRLSRTQITDSGLMHLKGLRNLERLYFNRTNISDVGFKHLEELPKLIRVEYMGTPVTTKGVKSFTRVLPNCRVKPRQKSS
jgi:Leucine-rich repeat (LRR) protein